MINKLIKGGLMLTTRRYWRWYFWFIWWVTNSL